MLTIPPGIEDPNYRYKMPKMQLKQESRGNGVKTNIFNLEDLLRFLKLLVLRAARRKMGPVYHPL